MRALQFLFFLFSLPTFAVTEIQTSIHKIDYGKNPRDEILVLLQNGQVAKVSDTKTLHSLANFNIGSTFNLTLDEYRYIIKMAPAESPATPMQFSFSPEEPFEPTIIKGNGLAKQYFWESRISRGETECFNRAHVWAYELWKNYQIKTQKIFIFFSLKYIREYNYEWWFHVAPLYVVKDWGGTEEKVADPRYVNAPRSIDWWLGKFIYNNAECPVVTKYSDYADFPYTQDCFIMKTPMYVYQPLDLEMEEVWGIKKTDFSHNDLTWAYREAFGMNYDGN